ncbi:hypothetical protein DSLASN_43420 [Desulfoluna limicola]|uniref:Uncharacterized protein n=1 Tax=Desulfoluna limicola TaxID=2810562 RepID=A0ABM7PNR5_9BACT|nr:hypothetical protein [Desulfoluna limicola]BCS98710.1 hypothetical protein DSLASN_43420 [Desulfoluna limicola]
MKHRSRTVRWLQFWGVMAGAFVIPSSGYVFFGKPVRGLLMLCWAFALGYITFQLTTPETPWMGRLSGGFTVWTLSLLETRTLAIRYFAP